MQYSPTWHRSDAANAFNLIGDYLWDGSVGFGSNGFRPLHAPTEPFAAA